MSFYTEENVEIIIKGYIKGIKNVSIPNDIICLVYTFYDKYIRFDVYNIDGDCVHKNKIKINFNYDVLFARNYDNKLSMQMDNGFLFENCEAFFNNKYCNVISQGFTGSHGFVCVSDTKLYGFGDNDCGQLGIKIDGNDIFNLDPTLVTFKFESPIKQIGCGKSHSLFLTMNGNVYNCQGGTPISKYNIDNIIKIGCCCDSNFMLNNEDILYTFGGNITEDIFIPFWTNCISTISTDVSDFNCGGYHMCFVKRNGILIFIGQNKGGQCGIDPCPTVNVNKGKTNPFNNMDVNITGYKCGGWHTIIKVNKDTFYSFGDDTQNCLLRDVKLSSCLPNIISNKYINELTCSDADIIDLIPSQLFTYILKKSD